MQLQLLTAVVKLFLKRPSDTQQLVQRVLSLATQDSDNPDLRDRGYIYWRLLSADPAAAKEVRSSANPPFSYFFKWEKMHSASQCLIGVLIQEVGICPVYSDKKFVQFVQFVQRFG